MESLTHPDGASKKKPKVAIGENANQEQIHPCAYARGNLSLHVKELTTIIVVSF
jgi:hypothetical protein